MLRIVRSARPALPLDKEERSRSIEDWVSPLERLPQRCHWIVPTSRRRRFLGGEWLRRRQPTAALIPSFHTLDSFVSHLLGYSPRQRPMLTGAERIWRLTAIWQELENPPPRSGLVNRLARFVQDWQACGLPPKEDSQDSFDKVVASYLRSLHEDGRLDRMSGVAALIDELASDGDATICRLLKRVSLIVFDGFHFLEVLEQRLIAELSRHCPVLVWLVGAADQPERQTVDAIVAFLQQQTGTVEVIDDNRPASTELARFGREISLPLPAGMESKYEIPVKRQVPGLFKLEADGPRQEVEAVAQRIKADFRAAQAEGKDFRLSDVAVVIPGPAYDPIVREVFPRAGLEFNLAGRALFVSASRPARVLTAAFEVIDSHWHYERLFDYLNHPLVRRKLQHGYRLSYWLEHRPRWRRRLNWQEWQNYWDRHLEKRREKLRRWQEGAPLPEHNRMPRGSFIDKERTEIEQLSQLTCAIKGVLDPVAKLEATSVDCRDSLKPLVDDCVRLLETLEMERWLTPPPLRIGEAPAVLWVEYEKDQQAYSRLLSLLKLLADQPARRLPHLPDGRLDARLALLSAMRQESYQIATEDDAGVQVFERRELRGLTYRHVYVLGLVEGVFSPDVDAMLPQGSETSEPLREQKLRKELEQHSLFRQFFEAARERLVLSRPMFDDQAETRPSAFFEAVEDAAELQALPVAPTLALPRFAAAELSRSAGEPDNPLLQSWQNRLKAWQQRMEHLDPLQLLEWLFPPGKPFSPSELETYAACPFRFFGNYVLRLEERDQDQTRMHYGSLVHHVLETAYTKRRQKENLSEDVPLPPPDDQFREDLRNLFEEKWNQVEVGLISSELKTLFMHEQGILQLLTEFIESHEKQFGNL